MVGPSFLRRLPDDPRGVGASIHDAVAGYHPIGEPR
jgi:hypothetical protein